MKKHGRKLPLGSNCLITKKQWLQKCCFFVLLRSFGTKVKGKLSQIARLHRTPCPNTSDRWQCGNSSTIRDSRFVCSHWANHIKCLSLSSKWKKSLELCWHTAARNAQEHKTERIHCFLVKVHQVTCSYHLNVRYEKPYKAIYDIIYIYVL